MTRLLPRCLLASLLLSCASGAPSGALCGGEHCAPPPKKPGHSLAASKLCRCKACEPHSCCEDRRDEGDAADCPNTSYDFTADESCSLAVDSCRSRCFEHSWRVAVDGSCSDPRPLACCD